MISVLGIITARGGSKAIPRKNIFPLRGKPLIAYTIDAAKQSTLLTRCIVSTDDEEIAGIARECGAEAPFLRPAELAQDHSTSIEVVQHALQWLEERGGQTFDYAMILQPTSPLRTAKDIDAVIEIAQQTGADSVMGMVEVPDFSVKKLKVIEDGEIKPFVEDEGRVSARRTDDPPVYKRNAAIYLTKTALLMQGDLFGSRCLPYVMPRERSIDVNDAFDFLIAETVLSHP